MRTDLPLLGSIEIASPCPMSWATMEGGATKRYCDSCRLHVHDLSAMTAQEAETLLQTHQGELCVRYTQDSEGRILTDEFPSRLRPLRSMVLKHCAMAAAFVLLACLVGVRQASAETAPATAKSAAEKKIVKRAEQTPKTITRAAQRQVDVSRSHVQHPSPTRLGRIAVKPAQPVKAAGSPILGKRVAPARREPVQQDGLTVKMGEPIARPAEGMPKSPALSGFNGQSFLGSVKSPAEIKKAQELNAVKAQETDSPKPLDNPKR